MNTSGWMSAQNLQQDSEWTFGQLLSVFLLGGAVLSLMNAWSGELSQMHLLSCEDVKM